VCVLNRFPKYHIKFLGDFNIKVGTEDVSKPTIRNDSLHNISNDNGVRVVNFATSKNLSRVQRSHTATFINTLGLLLMEEQSDSLCHGR
jgi:hypothetical protein